MAMHTFGSGFTEWGAGFGFALNGPDGGLFAYDASAYSGIVFWARLGDAGRGDDDEGQHHGQDLGPRGRALR